ncbi:unnamed protein product [Rhizophagus irregularis]|nr:unnamed protein product [Rhizophagus irregularis]
MEEEKFKKPKVLRLALSAPIEKTHFGIFTSILLLWISVLDSWMLDRHEILVTSSLDLWTCKISISNFEP